MGVHPRRVKQVVFQVRKSREVRKRWMELGQEASSEVVRQVVVNIEITYDEGRVSTGGEGKMGGNSVERFPVPPDIIAVNNRQGAGSLAEHARGMYVKGYNVRPVCKHRQNRCLLEGD